MRLLPTEKGVLALDVLISSKFDISKISWRNFERLILITSEMEEKSIELLKVLLTGDLDINRLLIYLSKSNLSIENFVKTTRQIIDRNMFSETITLSGGRKLSQREFLLKYLPAEEDIISYYHKNSVDQFMLLKYNENTDQALLIVYDKSTGLILDGYSRLYTSITAKFISQFEKENVED